MRQRFTVELERTIVKTATIEVVATNIPEVSRIAQVKARSDHVWNVDPGVTRITKITAHAGEEPRVHVVTATGTKILNQYVREKPK